MENIISLGRTLMLCLAALAVFAASPRAATLDVDMDHMLGQMVMVGFRGTGESPLTPDLQNLLKDVEDGKVGGIVLFEPDYTTKAVRNIKSIPQAKNLTAMLQSAASGPLFVAVDQEGGRVSRFTAEHGFPSTPSARRMGRGSPEATLEIARELGEHLVLCGVNLDFSPVVDVDVNAASPAIGAIERAFSADVDKVIAHARAFAAGLGEAGVLHCYKHFPGHGSAATDSHHGITDVTDTWSEKELRPYRELLPGDSSAMVMIGHLLLRDIDATYPASLSRAIVTDLLREQLSWDGVIVTDDLQMSAIADHYGEKEAIALAVDAGVDIILMGGNLKPVPTLGRDTHAILKELLAEGRISRERVAESHRRIACLKERLRQP